MVAPKVAQLIKRSEVLTVRTLMGQELYEYALTRGQYQLGSLRGLWPDSSALAASQINESWLLAQGQWALSRCAQNWPQALRAGLNLPELEGEIWAAPMVAALWFWVKKILLIEADSSWQHYFD